MRAEGAASTPGLHCGGECVRIGLGCGCVVVEVMKWMGRMVGDGGVVWDLLDHLRILPRRLPVRRVS